MGMHECGICGHIHDDEKEGAGWDDLPENWSCPVCASEKSYFKAKADAPAAAVTSTQQAQGELGDYLKAWRREGDDFEVCMDAIHRIAQTGESMDEPMRARTPVIGWDDILIRGAQLATLPLNKDEAVNTQTTIGPRAAHPLVIDTPVYVTHMSFGSLSREAKIALATGSAAVKTAM